MKRFWREVTVERGGVLLDGKPVRTPGRAVLILPNAQTAKAVADEWRAVGDKIDPRTMPLTGLANAAIDVVAPDPAGFAAMLAVYGESDLLCYRADAPPELVAQQAAVWDPLLAWSTARYDVAFTIATGVMHRAQPPATITRLARAVAAFDLFVLASLSPIVTIGGSLVIALALAEGFIAGDAAFDAAHVDAQWQAERWGQDAQAAETQAAARADFLAAARMLGLVTNLYGL